MSSFALVPGTTWTWARFGERWYGVDGVNPPVVREDNCEFRAMGLPAPDRPPFILTLGPGKVTQARLTLAYSFYDPETGRESKLSPWSNMIRADSSKIGAYGFQFPPVGASRIRVYANQTFAPLQGFFVTEFTYVPSVTLDWSHETLGLEHLGQGGLPPIGTLITAFGNRLYIAGSQEKNDWGGTINLTEGSNSCTLSGSSYRLPGKYLVGENLLVSGFDTRNVYLSSWDDVRELGTLEEPWEEATGSYSYSFLRNRSAVYFSDFFPGGAAMPESWDRDRNVLYVPLEDNEQVTGILGWGTPGMPTLVVGTENGLWVTSTRHEVLKPIETDTGTKSPRSLHTGYRGFVYFVGSDGQIYTYNGESSFHVSDGIKKYLEDNVDLTLLSSIAAFYDSSVQRDYYWFPDSQNSGEMFCLFYDHGTGQVFRADIDMDKVWFFDEPNESFILVKIGSSYYVLGFFDNTNGTLPGSVSWTSGEVRREGFSVGVVGRAILHFDSATDEDITISLINDDGTVLDSATLTIDKVDPKAFFRTQCGGFHVKLTSTGKLWVLNHIDIEFYPVRE